MPRRELWAVFTGGLFHIAAGKRSTANNYRRGIGGKSTVHRFIEVLPDGDDCGAGATPCGLCGAMIPDGHNHECDPCVLDAAREREVTDER